MKAFCRDTFHSIARDYRLEMYWAVSSLTLFLWVLGDTVVKWTLLKILTALLFWFLFWLYCSVEECRLESKASVGQSTFLAYCQSSWVFFHVWWRLASVKPCSNVRSSLLCSPPDKMLLMCARSNTKAEKCRLKGRPRASSLQWSRTLRKESFHTRGPWFYIFNMLIMMSHIEILLCQMSYVWLAAMVKRRFVPTAGFYLLSRFFFHIWCFDLRSLNFKLKTVCLLFGVLTTSQL